jgi:CubicO group peptidase (beta-lactamase class C family)
MEWNATRRAIQCVAWVLGIWFALIGTAPAAGDRVDEIVSEQMSKQHIPGLALAVIQDGKILRFSGYGVSNLEWRTPVTAKTVFAIASVSKQFLAAGAMVLVQEGKLSLDESVASYLTDAPPNWRPITTRELLTHTSGLPANVPGENPFETRPLLDSIRSAYGAPLSFPPGKQWQYSNLGYYVLAEILSRTSGDPWLEFMRRRLFQPLGMSATQTTNTAVPNRATGYEWDGQRFRRARGWGLRPSGAYQSDVDDLAKWDAALRREVPLSSATKAVMWTATPQSTRERFGYGFGWQIDTRAGHRVTYHGGGRSGFKAYLARFPDNHLTFVILTNAGQCDPEPILWKVASVWLPGVDDSH